MTLRKNQRLHYPCSKCGRMFERIHKEKLCIACKQDCFAEVTKKIRLFYARLNKQRKNHYYLGKRL